MGTVAEKVSRRQGIKDRVEVKVTGRTEKVDGPEGCARPIKTGSEQKKTGHAKIYNRLKWSVCKPKVNGLE